MRRTLVTCLAFATVLGTSAAKAEPPASLDDAIRVDANACFDRASVARRVRGWLRATAIGPRLQVVIEKRADGFAFVVLRSGTVVAERELNGLGGTCNDVADAVALAVAFALDATPVDARAAAQEALRPERPWPPLALAASDNGDRVANESPTLPGARLHDVLLSGGPLIGVLPKNAPLLALGLDTQWSSVFETHAGAFGTGGTSMPFGDPAGTTSTMLLFAGVFEGCLGTTIRGARLRGCAGGTLGVLREEGPTGPSEFAPWGGMAARLDARVMLPKALALVLALDGLAPFTRTHPAAPFLSTPLPPVGVFASTGLAFTFR